MLEDYYNLFIKQTHINHCVWKTKYAYIPKGIILHDFVRHSTSRKCLLKDVFANRNWLFFIKSYFFFMIAVSCCICVFLWFVVKANIDFQYEKYIAKFWILSGRSKSYTTSSLLRKWFHLCFPKRCKHISLDSTKNLSVSKYEIIIIITLSYSSYSNQKEIEI